MKVLVINCGSSSLKYQLIDMDNESVLCKGLCERIGMESSMITHEANGKKATFPAIFPTHTEAFAEVVKKMTTGDGKVIDDVSDIDAIGHRVVHGGEKFKKSCLITDEVVATIRELSPLAPLHNPAAILGIEAAKKVFGENIPNVAVFDTAFHSTMPPKAYMYAIPYEYYTDYGVRRYGFHGTSHKYVSNKAAEYLEEPITRLKLITCHLGNGSSITAVDQGKVVDTSMGMTPLAGLMMGTRCGDLDPSVVNYLKYTLGITGHELDEILNKKSGLLGISGVSSDKRDVEEAAKNGNQRAQLASDMLNYQIKKIVGSYIAAMGGLDAIVFTGGIGEHDAAARAKICHHMDWLGIRIDTDKNNNVHGDVCEITAWGARVRTLVIATNEELMIARDTKEVVSEL
ncbi:MAG: acetate/propionate family kinase [Gemmiger sp.]